MTGVLVDTSVWVEHFRKGNDALIELLEGDLAMVHPLFVGEVACGTPPHRAQTLKDLESLRHSQQASIREVLTFIEQEQLYGAGCGIVDMLLLGSTLMTPGVELWTHDTRLRALSERFGVMHRPSLH